MAYLAITKENGFLVISDFSFNLLTAGHNVKRIYGDYTDLDNPISFSELVSWKHIGDINEFIQKNGEYIWRLLTNPDKNQTKIGEPTHEINQE